MDSPIAITTEGHVMIITLNRPKVNAFNHELTVGLQSALRQAERDRKVRAVLLNAAGKIFSAGQDLTELQAVEGESLRKHLQVTYNPLILQLRRMEKPVIAALQGAVAGAALGVALACDLRIAAKSTRFLVGFSGIALAPDSGVSLLLPLMMGFGRATEYAFTNQPFTADQALAWGVVNRVVADESLQEEAKQWAHQIAARPLKALGLTKRAFNRAIMPHLEAVLDYEAHIQDIAGKTEEHHEGVQAFLEKREPKFVQD